MDRLLWLIICCLIIVTGCDKHTHVEEAHSEYETIEHACLHMADAGEVVNADSSMPGPHIDKEDFEHKRLKVALVPISGGKGGYIHFGPDLTGDYYVMLNKNVPVEVTNRTTQGDTKLDIEHTFTAQQIADSADCSLLEKAIIFEAQAGGNIIKIGPTTHDTVSVLIEEGGEGEHGH